MLTVDMSTLSRAELQRLLASARSRNQPGLETRVLEELEARASGAPRPMAIPAAPAPAFAARPARPARTGPRRSTVAGLSIAASAVVVLGWGLSVNLPQLDLFRSPAAAPIAPPQPPRATVALVSLSETPTEAEVHAAPQPPLPAVAPLTATPRTTASNPCYEKPTPAERLLCGYPSIALRDRALKDAYDRALAAGADPVVLATAQAAWRARSARIQEWQPLARSYDEQIRELEAAAASPQGQAGNP